MEYTKENMQELMNVAIEKADKYIPSLEVKNISDDFLEGYLRNTCNRIIYYQKMIKRYEIENKIPKYALLELEDFKRTEKLKTHIEDEYSKRIDKPDSTIFPIFPDANTGENFKQNYIVLIQHPYYGKDPIAAAHILISRVLSDNRDALNSFLKTAGFTNPKTIEKILSNLIKQSETKCVPKKETSLSRNNDMALER